MDLESGFRSVAVVGAGGKMGSGIALLLAQEMALRALEDREHSYALTLVDVSPQALEGLLAYLRSQAEHNAPRFAARLGQACGPDPARSFVEAVLALARPGTALDVTRESHLVFEAAFEDEAFKTGLYRQLASLCPPEALFFSNTSSIPIHALARGSGLEGRLAGFHFYNPPPLQELVELVLPEGSPESLRDFALALAKALGKHVVRSCDIAGFIGNGHLMRDGLHGLAEAERLAPEVGLPGAVALVNQVSHDWLLRPMGIFQLMDYVGLDVFRQILEVMRRHLGEDLRSPLLERLLDLGVKGGQTSAHTQKDGFFRYEKGVPVAVFDPEARDYRPLDPAWIEARLGPHPDPALSWKSLHRDPERETKAMSYLARLQAWPGPGAELARRYLEAERRTALALVELGVAERIQDVDEILRLGFHHLYSPVH